MKNLKKISREGLKGVMGGEFPKVYFCCHIGSDGFCDTWTLIGTPCPPMV